MSTTASTLSRTRPLVDRQPTGDQSEGIMALAAKLDSSAGKSSAKNTEPRRGVRRQPTGDMELELLAAIESDDDQKGEMPPDESYQSK